MTIITFTTLKRRFSYEFGEVEKDYDNDNTFFFYCDKRLQRQATRLINLCKDVKIVYRVTLYGMHQYTIELVS